MKTAMWLRTARIVTARDTIDTPEFVRAPVPSFRPRFRG